MSHFWAHLACFFKNRPNLLFLTRNGRVHFWKFWSFDQNRYKYSRGFYKGVPSSRNAFKSHYAKLLSLLSGFLTKQWAMSSIWGQKTGHSGLYRNMHFSKFNIWRLKHRFAHFEWFYQTLDEIWPLGVHFGRLEGDWSVKMSRWMCHSVTSLSLATLGDL